MKKAIGYIFFLCSRFNEGLKIGAPFKFVHEELYIQSLRFKTKHIRAQFDNHYNCKSIDVSNSLALENVDVFSLCHAGAVPEQKLSILSFFRHVGVPKKWTVVSDGSLSSDHINSLAAMHSNIEVRNWQSFLCPENSKCCEEFLKLSIFAKKLALESNLPVDGVTVYTDTDVVFFSGGYKMRSLLHRAAGATFYQKDLPGFLDKDFLTEEEQKADPLNAGFVILGKRMNWKTPLNRLSQRITKLSPSDRMFDLEKLEQATAHAAHFLSGSSPLDGTYVLQTHDRLTKGDSYSGRDYVMRHYVRPVRHKMWLHAKEYL